MNAVHDTLRTKAGDESLLPAVWSSWHAARSDVIGQCEKVWKHSCVYSMRK